MTAARVPAIVALAMFAILVPLLAVGAHSGDGMELVVAARHGGVLHPPGFPLQMWLDRVVVHVPYGSDAWRVGLVSALGHALAIGFLVYALRRSGVRAPGQLLCGAAFALFPACLTLAVQPEAFALAYAGCAASLDACVAASKRERSRVVDALLLGALVALCLAQHTITIVCAPAWLATAFLVVTRAPARAKSAIAGVGAFAVVLAALYASLLLAARGNVWPDWGKLTTIGDLVRHVSRAEYGVLDLMSNPGDIERRGIAVLLDHTWRAWTLLALLVLAGAWAMRGQRTLAVGIGGTLAAALAFLTIAVSRAPSIEEAEPTLERFMGVAVVPLAFLLGLGADAAFARLPRRVARARTFIAGVVVIALAVGAVPAVSMRADRTHELFLEAVALELPADAIYLGATDVETFGGVNGRFPVKASGALPAWYAAEVLPVVEPRLRGNFTDEPALFRAALATGAVVVASADKSFPEDVVRELRGVLFVAGPGVTAPLSQRTIDGAFALCPLLAQLGAVPEGHGRIRGLRRTFARAFEGASYGYAEQGRAQDAARARSIAAGLAEASLPATWRCE